MIAESVVVFFIYIVQLVYPDSYWAHVYYPQVFQDSQMYVVSKDCTRQDVFTLECWMPERQERQERQGTIELKVRASCSTNPIVIGISQRSHTRGQTWQTVEIANPEWCKPKPIYLPIISKEQHGKQHGRQNQTAN